jgi:hypothetical protein
VFFSQVYALQGDVSKSGLAIMERFISMPLERLNAKRVSVRARACIGHEMFTACEAVMI